jgi:RNA polymerase sigma-70 factor (ECF subfamily)
MDAAPSDEALIASYARGDMTSFEALYRRHELRVWRYLERNVRNRATADELMQEVWFAVARHAARYEPRARFTTWLFTIAHNRMVEAMRVQRRQISLDVIGYESAAVHAVLTAEACAGPAAAAVAGDAAAALHRALQDLPPEQREAFLLQAEGELEVQEIAAVTRSSFETTKSRLRYARSKLRELLKDYA